MRFFKVGTPLRVSDPLYDGDDVPEGTPQVTEGYRRRLEAFNRWKADRLRGVY